MNQMSLLGEGPPSIDSAFRGAERVWLDDEAWVDVVRGWVGGSSQLFEELRGTVAWRQERREMYEQMVEVPRLVARFPFDGKPPLLLEYMARELSGRYGFRLDRISASLYRDGGDSVAWHRDRGVREMSRGAVAIVSLGGPRKLAFRPVGGGPSPSSVTFGWGDLVVMGGTSNRTWEHGVPKCAYAEPRIALMFRHEVETWNQDSA